MKLTLLFRTYCSLCHQMQAQLNPLLAEYSIALEIVDIDDNPSYLAEYDEKVPVLLGIDGEEICHWHLNTEAVRAYLAKIR